MDMECCTEFQVLLNICEAVDYLNEEASTNQMAVSMDISVVTKGESSVGLENDSEINDKDNENLNHTCHVSVSMEISDTRDSTFTVTGVETFEYASIPLISESNINESEWERRDQNITFRHSGMSFGAYAKRFNDSKNIRQLYSNKSPAERRNRVPLVDLKEDASPTPTNK
ncbi:CLUMA_CG000112, isoform A [Clunio marinus]|uniref:CLUMA_CG000112, isoform A n=1 Tax=Clunio marinus TaxID=568069 RepID=A0A1J1HFN7_9DIPT|nr:CLUMA_CG000112, isoform A [Clunio marinus]